MVDRMPTTAATDVNALSMNQSDRITRRAFVGGVAGLAAASGLNGCSVAGNQPEESLEARAWNGYGGVGDYAPSHGNVWSVVNAAHSSLRDGGTDPQMTHVFGMAGFNADRDIDAIIFNRWGHAYSNPWPGFFFGTDAKPTAQQLLRQPWGRVTFGHSELGGKQTFDHAVEEGTRAAHQALALI